MQTILYDSLFQAAIISPVMGVVIGALFSFLTTAPSRDIPTTVVKTREIYIERVIVRSNRDNSKSGDDGIGILVCLMVGLIFLVWQYAVWAPSIHAYLYAALLGIFSFSITTTLISFLKGHFTSDGWWVFTLLPIFLLALDIYLFKLAVSEFNPELTQRAQEYSFFDFYINGLTEYDRNFMLTHVLGVVLLSTSIILLGLVSLYYLSLMNQRSDGRMQQIWSWFVRMTSFCSGSGWLLASIFLIATAYVCINPSYAATWLTG